jgi:septal ring factor EnvC (AmiA/AmiB activator)
LTHGAEFIARISADYAGVAAVAGAADHLPEDMDALKAALIETRAKLSGAQEVIEHLQLVIAKMQREKFGPCSERCQRLIDPLELQLEELVAAAERMRRRPRLSVSTYRLHAAPGNAAQLSRRSVASAYRSCGADFVPVLWQHQAVQDRRGHSPRRSMWCRGNGS